MILFCPDLVDELRHDFRQPENNYLAARWQNMVSTCLPEESEQIMQTLDFQAAQHLTAALSSPQDIAQGVKVGEAF